MSDDNGQPPNQVHPNNRTDIDNGLTDPAHDNSQLPEFGQDALALQDEGAGLLDGEMTMEDVDMLDAMHAHGLQGKVAGDGEEGEHVDFSALLQSLADQDGMGMHMDLTQGGMAENDGGNDGQQQQQQQQQQQDHSTIDAQQTGQDEAQADQDALMAAVRALEGMDGMDPDATVDMGMAPGHFGLGDNVLGMDTGMGMGMDMGMGMGMGMDLDLSDLHGMQDTQGLGVPDSLANDILAAMDNARLAGQAQQAEQDQQQQPLPPPPQLPPVPTFVRSTTPPYPPPPVIPYLARLRQASMPPPRPAVPTTHTPASNTLPGVRAAPTASTAPALAMPPLQRLGNNASPLHAPSASVQPPIGAVGVTSHMPTQTQPAEAATRIQPASQSSGTSTASQEDAPTSVSAMPLPISGDTTAFAAPASTSLNAKATINTSERPLETAVDTAAAAPAADGANPVALPAPASSAPATGTASDIRAVSPPVPPASADMQSLVAPTLVLSPPTAAPEPTTMAPPPTPLAAPLPVTATVTEPSPSVPPTTALPGPGSAPTTTTANMEIDDATIDPLLFADTEGFDPDTLANLAALSRIANEEDDEAASVLPGGEAASTGDGLAVPLDNKKRRKSRPQEPEFSREQVRAIVEGLSKGEKEKKDKDMTRDKEASRRADGVQEEGEDEKTDDDERDPERIGTGTDGDGDAKEETLRSKEERMSVMREVDREDLKDEEYRERQEGEGKVKRKRKRNRTTLSCTECHRRCDRNIPCSRCVARGVPGMCKIEYPNIPPPKKRKQAASLPINHELGLRVQALEMLLRANSNMDSGAANSAAMETIMQATRAAKAGNLDAGNALASLTTAAGGDLSKMEAAEQNGLLMEVLQQLSSASMARAPEEKDEEEIPEATDDPWSTVPEAAVESLLGKPDSDSSKGESGSIGPRMDLTIPGLRGDSCEVFVPPTIKHVEKEMFEQKVSFWSKDPLSIQGDPEFLAAATKFGYGDDSTAIKKDLSISITGALRIASAFLARFPPIPSGSARTIYVPDPTSWDDEMAIKSAGPSLEVKMMRFVDARGNGVDWEGMREDLMNAKPGSAVLLYVGGSMPSGAELSASLWRLLALILIERQLIPLCILAFQGLATGDPGRDAQPMRFMVREGLPVLLIQSFDSNMALHADSPSVLSLVTQSADVKARVESQFRTIARGLYLHPSPWGAYVVRTMLNTPRTYNHWMHELKAMASRLKSVREKLYAVIANKHQTPGNWLHIKRAHGMYCSTLLSPAQIRTLAQDRNIHLLPDGSLSLGALNPERIERLAKAIDAVVRASIKEAEEARLRAIELEAALTAAREAAAKEEAEAAARAAKEAEKRAMEEDAALMEQSIAEAMLRQAEEAQAQQREREDESRDLDEAIRKAQASVDIQTRADEILASIGQPSGSSHGR